MNLLRNSFVSAFSWLLVMGLCLVAWSCSSEKFVADGDYLLCSIDVESDNPDVKAGNYTPYLGQSTNSQWFSSFKVPLKIYSLAGRDSSRWINRFLWKIGEEPVIYSQHKADSMSNNLLLALRNKGYYHATVDQHNEIKGKKLAITYVLHPGEPFTISQIDYDFQDSNVAHVLDSLGYFSSDSRLKIGRQFSVPLLNEERKRVVSLLMSNGYYRFNKDFIEFNVDSTSTAKDVYVEMLMYKYKPNNSAEPVDHPRYRIRNVNFSSGNSEPVHLRQSVLESNAMFKRGDWYSSNALQQTYNNYARLQAVRYTNIRFSEVPDSSLLDCDIRISTNKPSTVSFQPEGTNTAGDFGAAASLMYSNRNLFHGSELFTVELRGAFEAITGLEGYQDENYMEYNIESKLTFPRYLLPFHSEEMSRRNNAASEFSFNYDLQNRPEFHRRVFSTAWRYRWNNPSRMSSYRVDLLDLNYVYMPWISATFKSDYLDSESNRNAILRYNYEDIFIMKIGLGYTYSDKLYTIRTNLETSGNILNGLSELCSFERNSSGQYTLFNIAYAQYVKGDIDFTRYFNFDERNSLALHASLGIAYPYGNSNMLPFEKRYFSGGANSVRGWSVRGLGPGKFRGTDGRIDFINQTGDMKLDLSAEYRTRLFWKVNGAVFIDAGNIWTLRDYSDQPGGQFKVTEFYKQIAVAYGLGLRVNFGYFVVRFDLGMKAINPAYDDFQHHYPLFSPRMSRDMAFHFAVGMPF